MACKLKILSLNVRGIRNPNKRRAMFCYLKQQKATIFCLQETYSQPDDEKIWSAEWGGKIVFCHGTAHSKGVCILLNPNSSINFDVVQSDHQGRILISKLKIFEETFFIVNIYAPTDYREQNEFIKNLSEFLVRKTDTPRLIIAGDWNCTLSKADKSGGVVWKSTNYRDAVSNLMNELNLIDIYRKLHPNTKSFTYESKTINLKSRIDFILVSRSISIEVQTAEIRMSIAPDHKATFLKINIRNEFNRGPGTWKFNNSLLEDDDFKERIVFFYPQIHEKYVYVKDKQLLWELIKMELRMKTIKYSKEKRLELRKRESTLQKELQDLDYKICNTDFEILDRNIFVEYEAAKEELKKIYEQKGKEAIFRSKVKWLEQGEKPTKYFFNLEKTNYEKKLIREVKLENGDRVSEPKQIEKELEKFYSNMYTSKNLKSESQGENKSFESFVEGIEIPQLNVDEQDSLEHDFTFEELKEAVSSFSDNKTPGEDGFTKEFYESFYDLIWRDLLNSYNAAFQGGSLSISQRRGIITLIPKADGDLSELSNWRPISLLNIDYKILTKALAKRIEKYLPKLIDSDQTGFVKGRYIGQNIRLLSDIMEYLNAKKTSGLLLFIDFEKAFDSLEWDLIAKALNVFNFGPNVKRWISIFYNGVQSAVINGGFLTNYFNISRGVRQGCPLSPLLFILAVELLAIKIRQEPSCRGVDLPDDQVIKISQFADDTTIITKNVESLKPYLQILDCFGIISGLKLNKKKTKVMWIGSMKDSNLKVLDFKTTKEPIKVLGVHLSYNKSKCTEKNFYDKINKMKTKLNLWLSRDLTIYGKSLLVKALGISQLVYAASMLTVPESVIKTVQENLFAFLWKNRKDKIKRMVMYQPVAEGGINFVNFYMVVKSLRLAWIGRLLGESDDKWKVIPNYYFRNYGGLLFLLKCNYNVKLLKTGLPLFYRELLQYFQDLKNTANIFPNGELILWNNNSIIIDNATLFWKSWFERGIVTIKDVLNSKGKFLSYEEFSNKFNITTNYMHYFQLISAIPSELKRRATQTFIPAADLSSTSPSILSNQTLINLAEARCKNYYQLFNNHTPIVPSGVKKWQSKFPEKLGDWIGCFQDIYRLTKDNKLRQFCFRFLHRTIVTKKELKLYHLAEDNKCIYCFNADSIEHTFIDCKESVKLYSQIISWFNHSQSTEIILSKEQIAFHDTCHVTDVLSDPLKRKLDLLIILVKQYIYASKYLQKELSLDELVNKLIVQWKLEKCA